jgi:hypothetical protein
MLPSIFVIQLFCEYTKLYAWNYQKEKGTCPMVKYMAFPIPADPAAVYNICEIMT